jgi:hypothetical protein
LLNKKAVAQFKTVTPRLIAVLFRFRPARLPRIQGSIGFAGKLVKKHEMLFLSLFQSNLFIVAVFH